MKRIKFVICTVALMIVVTLSLLFVKVSAQSISSNGTYEVAYEVSGTSSMGKSMISKNFSNKFILEKLDNNYYLSINYDTNSSMSDLKLQINELNIGTIIRNKNNQMTYTYTLSGNTLSSELPFSVYVSAMQRRTEFKIKINLDNANKLSDEIEDLGERPGEFVPTLDVDLADQYSIKAGNNIYFNIPLAFSKLGNEECNVTYKVLFNDSEIEINDNKILIEKNGIYKLIYKAESDKYKTSLGNNTYIEKIIIINASSDAIDVVKLVDKDAKYSLIGGIIESGSVFENSIELMKKKSVKYSTFEINFYDEEGNKIDNIDKTNVDVLAKQTIDRTKTKAYFIDSNNKLIEVESIGAGRYVRLDIDRSGTYIVCQPGIPFVMPMWGYGLICCSSILLVGGLIVFIIIKRHINKKRDKKLLEEK